LRSIALSSARGHAEPLTTFIKLADVFVKWHEGQHFPMRYCTKGRVALFSLAFIDDPGKSDQRPLTPLESAVPQNRLVNLVERTDPNCWLKSPLE
jgi:hypothetical protein